MTKHAFNIPHDKTAPSGYYLSRHAYCCVLNDGAVLLDLSTGRYLGIAAEHLGHLSSAIRDWPTPVAAERTPFESPNDGADKLIDAFCKRGLLTTAPVERVSVNQTAPTRAINAAYRIDEHDLRPIRNALTFVASLLQVYLYIRLGTVTRLIERLQSRQGGRPMPITDIDSILIFLRSFIRLRLWFYTATDNCLFDSLTLCVFLRRKNVKCTFLIGVSSKPFLAHSWVQMEEWVLNDTVEHVQTFAPLLIAGPPS